MYFLLFLTRLAQTSPYTSDKHMNIHSTGRQALVHGHVTNEPWNMTGKTLKMTLSTKQMSIN